MKTPVVEVLMWGKPIGLLSWNNELEIAVFEYNTTFSGSGIEVSPLKICFQSAKKWRYLNLKGLLRKLMMWLPAGMIMQKKQMFPQNILKP